MVLELAKDAARRQHGNVLAELRPYLGEHFEAALEHVTESTRACSYYSIKQIP